MKPTLTKVEYCHVCHSKRILDLGVKRNFYLANLDLTIPLTYVVCQDCQFIFQDAYVGDAFLNYYYQHSPMLRRKEPTVFEIGQNERQAEFLARQVSLAGQRVLEIGAHAGAFLRHLHQHYNCVAYFEELSEEARQVLASQPGLNDFRLKTGEKQVDVVVLRHVLEHIYDLDSFLTYLKSILAKSGSLFIEVPDWTHLDAHTDPFIFEHINHFNSSGLIHLLRRNGWQVEALEQSIHPDDPATPNRVLRLIARPTAIPPPGDAAIVATFKAIAAKQFDGWKQALNDLLAGEAKGKTIALYPASHLTFEALTETHLGQTSVLGMFDIDNKKHGKQFLGLTVYPREKLSDPQPDYILIFTMAYEREMRESFCNMGLTSRVISITELIALAAK